MEASYTILTRRIIAILSLLYTYHCKNNSVVLTTKVVTCTPVANKLLCLQMWYWLFSLLWYLLLSFILTYDCKKRGLF